MQSITAMFFVGCIYYSFMIVLAFHAKPLICHFPVGDVEYFNTV